MISKAIRLSSLAATACIFSASVGLGLLLRPNQPAVAIAPLSLAEVDLAQRPVAFTQPPQLVSATTSRNLVSDRNASYYLTLDLPAGANVNLQSVRIRMTEGRDSIFRFRPQDTLAFEGSRQSRGPQLPLGEVTQDREQRSLTVQFNPSVEPGRNVTLVLRPERNPRFEGVYLFEVVAYPEGEQVESYFTGYARLQFYETDNDPLIRGSRL
ncbi:MAG TPA: DUF2808 domain-containing protein [Trichocoleus sp.]